MKTLQSISPILALVIAFTAAGCSGNVESGEPSASDEGAASVADSLTPPPIGAEGEGRDVSGLTVLGPTWTEGALATHGGGGGSYTGHVTPAAVIYAVQTRSGTQVDAMRFGWYQPSGADNLYRSGDAWGWTPWYGGTGGGLNAQWDCPGGQGVLGLRGSSGTLVDRIGVICGSVNSPNPTAPSNTFSPLWGGGGGGWFEDKCSPGRLTDSFNVRSGTRLDSIQAICINAH